MNLLFYMIIIFALFLSITFASESDWMGRYPDIEKSRLLAVLTKEFEDWQAELHARDSVDFIRDDKNIVAVRDVLEDTSKTPIYMYNILTETLYPEVAELANDYYKEQRDLAKVPDEFCEFDAKFYKKLGALTKLYYYGNGMRWDELEGISSREEVVCEAAFFYGLIDFERAIACLDAAPPTLITCEAFSNFVADMYFGEAKRQDFSYEGDIETRRWLDDMVKKYEGGQHPHVISLMRRFTRNIRGKVDDKLWNDYIRAMMTVHLSAALLHFNGDSLKNLYDYLADNRILDEYIFASGCVIGGIRHVFLRTFKLDPSGETATMGIINSGEGIQAHYCAVLDLSELPDTITKDRRDVTVNRFIPFIVYDAVPWSAWEPAYTVVDTKDKAYFEHKQREHEFAHYKPWQYIDHQRAGTCSAMSLWSGLYWFERKSQQKLESFRLALYLEVLKEAAGVLAKLREFLERLDKQKLELADDEPEWDELQLMIKMVSDLEDDYLRFFSVGFNSAIRSIRYLHSDPFGQGLDMTAVMHDYAVFYESQAGEKYWQFVKPNIDDLFHSTYLRVIKPMIWVTPLNTPKISAKERDCTEKVNQAIKSRDPFSFVKAVIGGTDLKCQSKEFLASIYFGTDELDLQTHHQDLILRALAKEAHSFLGGKLPILRLIVKLIMDYGFKLFPVYDVLPNTKIDFVEESRQAFIFDEDVEMKQFAVNCGAFNLLAKNVLAAAFDLVKSTKRALPELQTTVNIKDTEEYKLYKNLAQRVITELQSIDPHLYAQYLASLIWNAEETGIAGYINLFRLSSRWNLDDYILLERATRGSGPHKDYIKGHFDKPHNLMVGRELASKYLPSLSTNLPKEEYICAGGVSRAIDADLPLGFVKAIASGVKSNCNGELFLSTVMYGISTLKLQPHHQHLILQALLRYKNVLEMFEFIDKLITEHGFKLFLLDDAPLEKAIPIQSHDQFFLKISKLEDDVGAQGLAVGLNADKSLASIILTLCTEYKNLTKLRQHFVNHVIKELREMNSQTRVHHLDRLIHQGALKFEELTSLKPSKE